MLTRTRPLARAAAGAALACWMTGWAAAAGAAPYLLASGTTWTQGPLPFGLLPDGTEIDLLAVARATSGLSIGRESLVVVDLGAGVAFADVVGSLRRAESFANDTRGLQIFTVATGRFRPFSPQDDLLDALGTAGAVAFRADCPRGAIGCPFSSAIRLFDPNGIFSDGFESGGVARWSNF